MAKKRVFHAPGMTLPDRRSRWELVRNMSDAEVERRAKADKDSQPIGPNDIVVDSKPVRRLIRWRR